MHFSSKTKNTFGSSRSIGYYLIGVGLMVLLSQFAIEQPYNSTAKLWTVSMCIFIAGIFIAFTHEGIIINFKKKFMKSYLSFFGLKFGKWKPLPAFTSISIIKSQSFRIVDDYETYHPYSQREIIYKIFLKQSNSKMVASIGRKSKVLKDAQYLAEKLSLPIYKK